MYHKRTVECGTKVCRFAGGGPKSKRLVNRHDLPPPPGIAGWMGEFYRQASEVLAYVNDVLMPRDDATLRHDNFQVLVELVRRPKP